mmetsp:Transcript_25058/g.36717  ORF Transcript_25058/g.36717 Transcript_25058/m.36717 type:complete len:101 (-) Transcript_25058:525-827(-)
MELHEMNNQKEGNVIDESKFCKESRACPLRDVSRLDVFHESEANGVIEEEESEASVKKSEGSSLSFSSGEAHSLPKFAAHWIWGFKEPSYGNGRDHSKQR